MIGSRNVLEFNTVLDKNPMGVVYLEGERPKHEPA